MKESSVRDDQINRERAYKYEEAFRYEEDVGEKKKRLKSKEKKRRKLYDDEAIKKPTTLHNPPPTIVYPSTHPHLRDVIISTTPTHILTPTHAHSNTPHTHTHAHALHTCASRNPSWTTKPFSQAHPPSLSFLQTVTVRDYLG